MHEPVGEESVDAAVLQLPKQAPSFPIALVVIHYIGCGVWRHS